MASNKSRQNWIFGLAIAVSAFLLFQIQPLISKYILPWFGGGTSVWTTAQVFFQMLLLGGYAYAHWISRLKAGGQGRLHLGVMAVVAVWLVVMGLRWDTPVTPGAAWKPEAGASPAGQVLVVLLAGVGLPYFLLSTSSSLLQSWYSRLYRSESPYSFYIVSNTASLLALLSYPVLFEPTLSVREQALFWTAGFVVYLGLVGLCAWQVMRFAPDAGREEAASAGTEPVQAEAGPTDVTQAILQATNEAELEAALRMMGPQEITPAARRQERPGWGRYLFWIGLAACATTMSLAVTNQMTQDVASVPFLWVLPLSLYLLSFIVGFNDRVAKQRGLMVILMLAALGAGLLLLTMQYQITIWQQLLANCFVLFVVCLFCHSSLYHDRPHPAYLTSFYLMLSLGGAAGGVLVSLVAPVLFRGFWEFPLALIFCALVILQMTVSDRHSLLYRLRIPVIVLTMVLEVFIMKAPFDAFTTDWVAKRNFYGLLRIRESHYSVDEQAVKVYNMLNGSILHGVQAAEDPWRRWPSSYYTHDSGAAIAIRGSMARQRGNPVRAGFVGLGIGTLAVHGLAGDTFRFYEINPQVIEIAQDEQFFHYLNDSLADIEIVEGDARLSMEQELEQGGSQRYDVLVVDAFSGDSIPVHLISKEAIELYLAHLKPEGVIAFHISNRYIDLEPVLWRVQEEMGLQGVLVEGSEQNMLESFSRWVLLTNNAHFLAGPEIKAGSRPLTEHPEMRLWTDDYSNLLQVLK